MTDIKVHKMSKQKQALKQSLPHLKQITCKTAHMPYIFCLDSTILVTSLLLRHCNGVQMRLGLSFFIDMLTSDDLLNFYIFHQVGQYQ